MKKTIQFSAYQYFLADNFADNRKKWELYAKNMALRFLSKYNENLDHMLGKLESFVENRDSLTLNETNQLKVISNLTSLCELLNFNSETKSITIDYVKIDAIFLEIKDQEEIRELKKAIGALGVCGVKESNSFAELDGLFDSLIFFVKSRDFRRTFYLEYLIKDELFIPKKASAGLFLNRNII